MSGPPRHSKHPTALHGMAKIRARRKRPEYVLSQRVGHDKDGRVVPYNRAAERARDAQAIKVPHFRRVEPGNTLVSRYTRIAKVRANAARLLPGTYGYTNGRTKAARELRVARRRRTAAFAATSRKANR